MYQLFEALQAVRVVGHLLFSLEVGGRTCAAVEKAEPPDTMGSDQLLQGPDLLLGIIDKSCRHEGLPQLFLFGEGPFDLMIWGQLMHLPTRLFCQNPQDTL